jgi:hypothetical protein
MKDDFFDYLPDGSKFAFWDCETEFTKTYYVSKAANARDDNPGTREAPFATINRAAALLQPGERVVIGGGVYDEFVRPPRGGEGPKKMISYEGAPGERAIISGARVYQHGWKDLEGWRAIGPSFVYSLSDKFDPDSKIYEGNFEYADFDRLNPFSMVNCPSQAGSSFWFDYIPKEQDWQPFLQRRGLLFCDGEALTQVSYLEHLSQLPGTYWVEDSGLKFFVRLKDDGNPRDHVITYTCREQCFAPAVPFTSYVRVKGLEFECVGNGVPGPQKGALSTFCGHHWIIEDNHVRWANGVGIDIGHETMNRVSDKESGGTLVRRNHVSNIGVCGITGSPNPPWMNQGILIESNVLDNCCWMNIEFNYESGAIKVHGVRNGLIRFNIITNNKYGSSIWTDYGNINERICGNVVLGVKSCIMGGIFVEASDEVNLVDHNLVYDVHGNPNGTIPQRTSGGGHGIYEHDSDYIRIERNILLETEGAGIFLNWGDPIRVCNGHTPMGVGHVVSENIISGCPRAYVMPSENNSADGNILGQGSSKGFGAFAPIHIERNHVVYEKLNMRSARKFRGWEKKGRVCPIEYQVDQQNLRLTLTFMVGENRFTQHYDLTKPFDLQPVFDFLNTQDTAPYEKSFF